MLGSIEGDLYPAVINVETEKPPQRRERKVTISSEDAEHSDHHDSSHDDENRPLLSSIDKKLPFPKSVFFIFLNEFCERYSFYGLEAILALFLRNVLNYTETASTVIYHVFVVVAFSFPFIGGIFGDSVLGKFKTTVYFSIAHSIGSCALAVGALPFLTINMGTLVTIIALLVTAVGIGGIKPNVAAFGGDQFVLPEQSDQLTIYFSIYYVSINVGATLSEIFTPMLRKDVGCFGQDTCYSLAFAVPAILMIFSLVTFVLGKRMYKIKPVTESVTVNTFKCICYAIGNRSARPEGGNWLDSALDKYSQAFIQDIKDLFQVVLLLSPLTIFWSLWTQMGTTWTFQATRMNGYLTEAYAIKPDQLQVTNSFLILFLIPFFDMALYPCLAKCKFLVKPIQRIAVGCFLMILSFVVAGVLELELSKANPVIPGTDQMTFNFVNALPCRLTVSIQPDLVDRRAVTGITEEQLSVHTHLLETYGNTVFSKIPAVDYNISISPECAFVKDGEPESLYVFLNFSSSSFLPQPGEVQTFLVTTEGNGSFTGQLRPSQTHESLPKSDEANAKIRFVGDVLKHGPYFVHLTSNILSNYSLDFDSPKDQESLVFEVDPGTYNVSIVRTGVNGAAETIEDLGSISVWTGGSYLVGIFQSWMSQIPSVHLYTLTKPNVVHVLWQLPQYILLTLAEILVAVTGYHFAYDQAPPTMKSTLQSVWLMTNAGGNLIVVFFVAFNIFPSQAVLFFFFAGLMALGTAIFILLGRSYIPRSIPEEPPTTPPSRRRPVRKTSIAEAVATGIK